MGLVVATFGDSLSAELPACLPVLVDRMGNEITRLTAVKVGILHIVRVLRVTCEKYTSLRVFFFFFNVCFLVYVAIIG